MNNIKIYPEISILDLKILNNYNYFEELNLYDNQYYNFEFLLLNSSNFKVKEILIYVYAYKKDDYKICIDEINLKVKDSKYIIKLIFKAF